MRRCAPLVRHAGLLLVIGLVSFLSRPWLVEHLGKASPQDWPIWASGAGWLLFSIYWEISAKNAAPAAISESRASRGLHVFMANAALILIFIPIHGLRQRYLPGSPFVITAGLAIEALGLLLAVWARLHLGRNWSGEITIKVDHQLVRSGPYRVMRHPMYTALLGMYTGSAIVSGELHALLGLALAGFAYGRKLRLEEANLLAAFGADYRAYCRETWVLLPGLF